MTVDEAKKLLDAAKIHKRGMKIAHDETERMYKESIIALDNAETVYHNAVWDTMDGDERIYAVLDKNINHVAFIRDKCTEFLKQFGCLQSGRYVEETEQLVPMTVLSKSNLQNISTSIPLLLDMLIPYNLSKHLHIGMLPDEYRSNMGTAILYLHSSCEIHLVRSAADGSYHVIENVSVVLSTKDINEVQRYLGSVV